MLHGGAGANCYLKEKGVWLAAPLITFPNVTCVCGDAAQVDTETRRRASAQYPGLIKQRVAPVSRRRKWESTEVARKRTRCSDNGVNCLIGGWLNVPLGAFTPHKPVMATYLEHL